MRPLSGSDEGLKICRDCKREQPLSEFPRNRSRRDGYGIYCKLCYSIRYREYRERKASAEGREIREIRRVAAGQKFCPKCEQSLPRSLFARNRSSSDGLASYCRSCHNEVTKANRERSGGSREYHLRRRYGIGQADVDAMVAEQEGLCAACRIDKPAHVDHDHETGQVRGMLCFLCNQALGNVRDDIARLEGLIRYLKKAQFKALGVVIEEYEHTGCVIEIDSRGFHAA